MNKIDYSRQFDADRCDELLRRYFEGTLSEVEAFELLEIWDRSESLLRQAVDDLHVENALRFFGGSEAKPFRIPSRDAVESDAMPDLDELVRLAAASKSLPKKETPLAGTASAWEPIPLQKETPRQRFLVYRLIIPALILVASIAIYSEFRDPHVSKPVISTDSFVSLARISALADPVFSEDAPLFRPGQHLGHETVRLDSGMIELRLENGVRIAVEGPATFNIQSAMKTFCQQGRMSVDVPGQAKGFEVLTPLMNVRDLGTSFVVEASETASEVHVIRGKVEFQRFAGPWVPLREGVGMILKPKADPLQTIAKIGNFLSEQAAALVSQRYENDCRDAWNMQNERWRADPSLLLQTGTDAMSYSSSKSSDTEDIGLVRVQGCRRAAGRRTGLPAVSFHRGSDAVHLSASGKYRSFTMIAAVRLQDLSRVSNVIFSVGDVQCGSIHWQIDRGGELRLLIAEEEDRAMTIYAGPATPPQHLTDVWIVPATVVDAEAGTVTHYLNGRKIATLTRNKSNEFDFSGAVLGNWVPKSRRIPAQYFNGSIGEFTLLGRAASEEEIHLLSK